MKSFTPLVDKDAVECILSNISFLGGLKAEQLETMFGYFETAHFNKGEFIARRGEEPSHIYIIRKGTVGLLIDQDGVTVKKRTFGVGDCFGEAAMLSLINNTASFVAVDDCELVAFSRKAFNRLRSEAPGVFCQVILNLARDLARKLQYTDEMLVRPDKLREKSDPKKPEDWSPTPFREE